MFEQFVVTYGPTLMNIIVDGLLLPLIAAGFAWIVAKTKSDKVKRFLDDIDDKALRAVVAANQTFVDELKKQGKFDAEAQQKIFAEVMSKVITMLTDDGMALLDKYTGDGLTWLRDTILMHVRDNKLEV